MLSESLLADFRREYFGPIDQYLAWHDGYEANAAQLDALPPAERAQAAQELLAALRADQADARAVLGLSHLRCEEALPLLHHLLNRGFASFYVLQAIAHINPAGLYQPWLAQLLGPKTPESQLIDLLTGLRESFTLPQLGAQIPAQVFALLAHPAYLVRYHALATLRHLYGLQTADQLLYRDVTEVRADVLFTLISPDKRQGNYRRAQQLLLAQLPPGTRATLPAT